MNPIIISTIIGVASFILTIFSATYLSQRHTDKLVEQLEKRFDARIADLKSYFDARFDMVNAEFRTVRAEIGTLRAESKAEMHALNEKVDRIDRIFQQLYRPVLPGDGD